MDDSEQEVLRAGVHSDSHFLAATTIAAILLAGSAYIWRSNILKVTSTNQRGDKASKVPDRVEMSTPLRLDRLDAKARPLQSDIELHINVATPNDAHDSDSKELKSPRPKERRRRGKDPLKEIFKSGKRFKASKPGKLGDTDERGVALSTLPQIQESVSPTHSRNLSIDGRSSRSASTSSSRRTPQSTTSREQSDAPRIAQELELRGGSSPSSPSLSASMGDENGSMTVDELNASEKRASDPSNISKEKSSIPESQSEIPAISLSISSTSQSGSSAISSSPVVTPNTSPALSSTENPSNDTTLDVSLNYSPLNPSDTKTDTPTLSRAPASTTSWDWNNETITPTLPELTTHRKPPRFQTKSRRSASPASSPTVFSASTSSPLSTTIVGPPPPTHQAASSSHSHTSSILPSTSEDIPEDGTFSYPTLNPPFGLKLNSSDPANSSHLPAMAETSHPTGSNGTGHYNGITSRRVPTPRRTPTPSSRTSTPPPSLSIQTQLASVRGALEAARQREEKVKVDMERYMKELEMLRWENSSWRRRELELQAQIHHMMQQLQLYATLLSTMNSQPSATNHPHNNGGNVSTPNSPNPRQNGFPGLIPPLMAPPHHLHMLSPVQNSHPNGILSPTAMVSPMSTSGQPSPYFSYPSHLQSNAHQPSSHQVNLFSIFPPAANAALANCNSPSGIATSGAGSSSAGSMSPDSSGSPVKQSALLDRGRQRTRTQTQGDRAAWVADGNDGWMGVSQEGGSDGASEMKPNENEYHDDDEGDDFNEALADAILKRPGSIRVRSSKGRSKDKDPESEELDEQTEFTFPSLSDLGNVSKGRRLNGELTGVTNEERIASQSISELIDTGSGAKPNIEDVYAPSSSPVPLQNDDQEITPS